MDGQKGYEAIQGMWVCELEEMMAVFSSKGSSQKEDKVKAFISTTDDYYRAPYTKRAAHNKRSCIFLGTTNRDTFLCDKTGARRWFPIRVKSEAKDLYDSEKEFSFAIELAWAEMKAAFDNGEEFARPVPAQVMMDEICKEQETAEVEDYRVGLIEQYLVGKDMGIFPVAGLNARQRLLTLPLNSAAVSDVCHQPRVSFDPPGCGSGMRVPALPEPCCHHGAQGGRLPFSLSGFPAVPPQRLSMFLQNSIDKSFSHRRSCRAVAGKHHSFFGREKTRKEAALSACSHPFRVFQNSRLFNSHGLFGSKKLCVAQMGIAVPMSTFSIPKKLSSQLSKSHRRENRL